MDINPNQQAKTIQSDFIVQCDYEIQNMKDIFIYPGIYGYLHMQI